jgi:hypothetical protein
MGAVTLTVVIDRPIAEVFGFVTDLRHDVHWYQGVQAVRVLSESETGIDTVYEQRTRLFGVAFTGLMKVTKYDPPRHMTLLALRSLTPFTARYNFESLAPESTRFTLDAEVSGAGAYRLFGPLLVPMIRSATAKRLRALKHYLEAH